MGLNTPSAGGGAPTGAEYVTGSSSSGLSNETVVSPASEILTQDSFGNSQPVNISFGSFTVIDADNPTLFTAQITAVATNGTDADVDLLVDESGGTSRDYRLRVADADGDAGGTITDRAYITVPLPAGAAIKLLNEGDPDGSNSITDPRALPLTV